MEKILLVRNKEKKIKLTNKKNIKKIAKENNAEIIEITNVELWKKIKKGKLSDENFKKIWLIVKDYKLAKKLELMGYQVFNNSKTIEICDNKGLQYIYIEKYMPKTQLCPLIYDVKDISSKDFDEIQYPCILKEYYNSRGVGVYKVKNEKELNKIIKKIKTNQFLIQDFIPTNEKRYNAVSYRVNVVGDEIIGVMKNCNLKDFRTQRRWGGKHYISDIPEKVKKMVIKSLKKIGNDFAGVDVIKDSKTNRWYINEVNCSGGLAALSKLYKKELVEKIIKYIVKKGNKK